MAEKIPKSTIWSAGQILAQELRPPPAIEVPPENIPPHTVHTDSWRQALLLILGVSLAGIALSSALFFVVFHGSLAKISAAGIPIHATSSQAAIEQQINLTTQQYKLTVRYTDGRRKTFPLNATGIVVDAHGSAASVKKTINSSFGKRLAWWRPISLSLDIKKNPAALRSFIDTDATEIKIAPQDASLSIDNGSITISQDVQGKGSKIIHPEQAIPAAITKLQTAPLVFQPVQLTASITTKDLQTSQQKAQAVLSQPVSFTIAGNTVTPAASDIANWIELTPVKNAKTVDVTVDSGKVLQYLNKIARRYIQPPRSRLVVSTDTGQVVLDPGADGVDIVNKDQTAAAVAKQLLQNKPVNMALAVQYAAAQTVEAQPYDKWLVADVTTKRLYAYEQTSLVRSFLVSAGAPATPTVTGTFAIYAKYASQDMSGANADGSRYFQPAVPYVNYFYGGYAIHGNYWRPASWFGNINSSHGCLGVTVDDGAWIYDWAPIGTPVIVHT